MQKAWCCSGKVAFCLSRSSVKYQCHTVNTIVYFDLNWGFPDCNSNLNSPMALKWCPRLVKLYRRGSLLFFKVIYQISRSHRTTNSPIFLTQIERLQTPVWIHRWIWNDVQTFIEYRRGALWFFMSSIKYQGRTGWKINNFNPIWVWWLGRSQLLKSLRVVLC